MLVVSFQNYLSSEERQCSEKILKENKEENKEDLPEVLSTYNCFKKPSKDSAGANPKTEIYSKCFCGSVQILPTITKPFSETQRTQ